VKRVVVQFIILVALFFVFDSAYAVVRVRGYTGKDGTYVQPHYRSNPDGNFYNNWSTKGNVNPYTGKPGTKTAPNVMSDVFAGGSYRSNGTYGQPQYESNAPLSQSWQTTQEWQTNAEQIDVFAWDEEWRAIARAKYWKERGYNFDPTSMKAYEMDRKVEEIERANRRAHQQTQQKRDVVDILAQHRKLRATARAAYWKSRGHEFDPELMTAYEMDQKVKDLQRAEYWKVKGYDFDASSMTADQMDQKVKDIKRAKYWKAKGYEFDADLMTADQMDQQVQAMRQPERAKE